MKQLLPLALAGLALSAVPLAGPSFRAHTLALGGAAQAMVVAPLDADATPDVALVIGEDNHDASLLTLRGVGNGRLQMENLAALAGIGYTNRVRMTAAHLDGDALIDLALMSVADPILLGDGDLSFEGSGFIPTFGGQYHDLGFSDFDDDGDLDSMLLVNDFGGSLIDIGANDGQGNFGVRGFIDAPTSTGFDSRLHFADLDGDGRDETLSTGAALGMSSNTLPHAFPAVGHFPALLTAHLNADDALDIALASPLTRGVVVLLNDGAGGFPRAQQFSSFGRPECLAAGDVTGNGHTDLVVANRDNGTLAVLENDGAGQFTRVVRLPVSADPIEIEVADLDADGDLDVIVAGRASAELTVLLNQLAP